MIRKRATIGSRRSGLAVGGIVLLLGLLVVAAVLFSRAVQIERVADDAGVMQAAEQVNTAAAVVQANLGVLLVLSDAESAGIAVGDDLSIAAQDTRDTLDALSQRIAELKALGVASADGLSTIRAEEAMSEVEDLLAAGDIGAAIAVARDQAVGEFISIAEIATTIRDAAASRVAAERAWAGTITQLASWAVALLMPLAGLIIYRIAIRRDLQRRRAEEKLEQEQAALAMKDQFIANLSHELRTPLTSILGFSLELDEGLDHSEIDRRQLREMNSLVLRNTGQLRRMVEDLLIIDQPEPDVHPLVAPVPLARLVESATDVLVHSGVGVAVENGHLPVVADSKALIHVLRNLVANAIDHGAQPVRVVGRVTPMAYEIEVRDNGPGVAEGEVDRLFERYFHDEDRPLVAGTLGMGTAVARKLARGMGGDVGYLREGTETVFRVSLPRDVDRELGAA